MNEEFSLKLPRRVENGKADIPTHSMEIVVGRFSVEEVSMESCQTSGVRAARSRTGPSEPGSGEPRWFQAPRRQSSLCDLSCCFSPISWEERQIQEDRVPQTGPVL